MIHSLLFVALLATNTEYNPPHGGRCLDSRVNVGYLFSPTNAKRVIEIDKLIPTDPLFAGYPIGYVAKTRDGSMYLTTRDAQWLAPSMYDLLSEVAQRRVTRAMAGRTVMLMSDKMRKALDGAPVSLQRCIAWPSNVPLPDLPEQQQ